jgi:hypothetical protein
VVLLVVKLADEGKEYWSVDNNVRRNVRAETNLFIVGTFIIFSSVSKGFFS